MKNNEVIEKILLDSKIQGLNLNNETIEKILVCYGEILFDQLLSNGRIDLENGMSIEIVQLLERVHVLRGVKYKSSRKYKLKLTMEEDMYKRIEDYYDKLKEEIS